MITVCLTYRVRNLLSSSPVIGVCRFFSRANVVVSSNQLTMDVTLSQQIVDRQVVLSHCELSESYWSASTYIRTLLTLSFLLPQYLPIICPDFSNLLGLLHLIRLLREFLPGLTTITRPTGPFQHLFTPPGLPV